MKTTNTQLWQLLSGGIKPHRSPSHARKVPALIGKLCPSNADLIDKAYASGSLRQLNWATAAWMTLPASTRSDARVGGLVADEKGGELRPLHSIELKVLPKEKN